MSLEDRETVTLESPEQTVSIASSANPRRVYIDLFLISFFLLFFELACIRWFGSMVVFLTFFTNIVLLACFLGMSVGLLTASRRANFITWVLPLTLVTALLAAGTFWAYESRLFADKVSIDVGHQKSPQLIFFGTEYRDAKVHVPMPVFAGVFFTLISLMFIGLGQTMGR